MSTKKEQCVKQLEEVKAAHLKLMESIDMALSGLTINYYEPLSKYECTFGKWFYNSDLTKIVLGPQIYERLEQIHEQWHHIYAKIYHLLFPKKGLLGKLFLQKPKLHDIDKAKAYYHDLLQLTDELVYQLKIAQKRAQALNESKFS